MNALAQPTATPAPWNVLVVDDDEGVLDITRLTLRDLHFAGREVALHDARSAAEARDLFQRIPDVALVLLDVVMETDDAGLQFVKWVRDEVGNRTTRIILRTGQPGLRPPLETVTQYEVDGYCAKTDLSSLDLKVIVLTALRTLSLLRELTGKAVPAEPAQATASRPAIEAPTSTQPIEQLLESLELPVASIDAGGVVVGWNEASERLLGYAAPEVLGLPYERLIPTEFTSELRKGLDKLRHLRRVPTQHTQRRHKDGRVLEVLFSLHPRPGGGAYITLRDVSSEKQVERQLKTGMAEIEAIVKTVLDAIITINERGVIEAFNPAAERIFGYRAHEVIGHNVKVLMPEPVKSLHDGYLNHYLETGEARVIGVGREVIGQRKDGSPVPLELAVAPMKVGERRAFVGVLHDISERKAAERELRGLNQALETKVTELAETLQRLSETQEQLVQAEKLASLGGLVAGVAHEINTPIGICVTAASYLLESVNDVEQSAQDGTMSRSRFNNFLGSVREAARLLSSNTQRASNLISSFKQVAVDRSSAEARIFDLRQFLVELLPSLRPLLRRHQIEVDCEEGLSMHSQAGALSQVMTNLLINASQHAYPRDQAGKVDIVVRPQGSRVRIEVIDHGDGIPPENIKRVFDPFFTTARGRGGTGLGLHIVYNLVTHTLGGTITVESEFGRGSCFIVSLPLRSEPAAA